MSDAENRPAGGDDVARALLASSRAERPAEGARGRAFDAAVRELEGAPVASRRTPSRALRIAFVFASPVLVLALLVAGLLVKDLRDAQRAKARIQAEVSRLAKESEALEGVARLRSELANSRDPAKVAELQRQLSEAKEKASVITVPARAGGGQPAAAPVVSSTRAGKAACNCTPGDPLCSCL
jgi:hypothetical protein